MRMVLGHGKKTTEVIFPDGYTVLQSANDVTRSGGVWDHHGGNMKDGGKVKNSTPDWLMSDSPELASLLAAHYACEIREVPQ